MLDNNAIVSEYAKYLLHIQDGSANSYVKLDDDQLEAIEQRANLLINFAEQLAHATSTTASARASKDLDAFAESTALSANKLFSYKKASAEYKAVYRLAYIANYLVNVPAYCNFSAIVAQYKSYCVYLTNCSIAERRAIYSAMHFWGELPATSQCIDLFELQDTFLLPGVCTELTALTSLEELKDLFFSYSFEPKLFTNYIKSNWPAITEPKHSKAIQQLEELSST